MNFYFKEPRLRFTSAGEFLVKLVTYSTYAFLVAIVALFFIGDVAALQWTAILISLFLVYRAIHINRGDRTIKELKAKAKKKDVNLTHALTPSSHKLIDSSFRKALNLNKNFNLILIKRLISKSDIKEAFERLGVDTKELKEKIEKYQEKEEVQQNRDDLLSFITKLVIKSFYAADNTNEKFIHPRNLLVGAAKMDDPHTKKLLNLHNIEAWDIREAIIFGRYRSMFSKITRMPSVLGGFAHSPGKIRKRIMNRAWTARPTPFLDNFSTDLTALARREQVGLLIGHNEEFNQLLNILSRPDKPNAIIVGESGVGKSTLIAHLAYRIIKDEVPKVLFDKRLVSLDIGSLIADAPPEKIVSRLNKIANEIVSAGNIALFIPNIHDLFKSVGQNEEAMNAMDVLLPIIQSNDVPFIGETYPQEFKSKIEKRGDFMDQFEEVRVEEVTQDEAVRILTYQSLILENEFNMKISLKAIKKSVFLAFRYLHKKPLPSSAVDLLKQALAKAQQEGYDMLDKQTVIEVASELSNVPIKQAEGEEVEKLLNLEKLIHERLINQDAAVKAVARSLREYRSGLSREGGPIATFLFVGPTGVGKTELSKQLSKIHFGSKDHMIRFDMSEYQDKKSAYRLIGTPDGEKTGSLTDAIEDQPYSLILLDEFEKAHPDILNIFLQVFDDGRLTDSLGKTVKFENTIIIATSNAHSNFIKDEIEKGKTATEISQELKQKLTSFFKPELLNRFSDVIVFRNLNRDEIKKIAKILIEEMSDQLRKTQGIDFVVDDSAAEKIADLGYSPVFGARPLRNTISENLKSVLAEKILRKEIKRGDVVKVAFDDKFKFEVIDE